MAIKRIPVELLADVLRSRFLLHDDATFHVFHGREASSNAKSAPSERAKLKRYLQPGPLCPLEPYQLAPLDLRRVDDDEEGHLRESSVEHANLYAAIVRLLGLPASPAPRPTLPFALGLLLIPGMTLAQATDAVAKLPPPSPAEASPGGSAQWLMPLGCTDIDVAAATEGGAKESAEICARQLELTGGDEVPAAVFWYAWRRLALPCHGETDATPSKTVDVCAHSLPFGLVSVSSLFHSHSWHVAPLAYALLQHRCLRLKQAPPPAASSADADPLMSRALARRSLGDGDNGRFAEALLTGLAVALARLCLPVPEPATSASPAASWWLPPSSSCFVSLGVLEREADDRRRGGGGSLSGPLPIGLLQVCWTPLWGSIRQAARPGTGDGYFRQRRSGAVAVSRLPPPECFDDVYSRIVRSASSSAAAAICGHKFEAATPRPVEPSAPPTEASTFSWALGQWILETVTRVDRCSHSATAAWSGALFEGRSQTDEREILLTTEGSPSHVDDVPPAICSVDVWPCRIRRVEEAIADDAARVAASKAKSVSSATLIHSESYFAARDASTRVSLPVEKLLWRRIGQHWAHRLDRPLMGSADAARGFSLGLRAFVAVLCSTEAHKRPSPHQVVASLANPGGASVANPPHPWLIGLRGQVDGALSDISSAVFRAATTAGVMPSLTRPLSSQVRIVAGDDDDDHTAVVVGSDSGDDDHSFDLTGNADVAPRGVPSLGPVASSADAQSPCLGVSAVFMRAIRELVQAEDDDPRTALSNDARRSVLALGDAIMGLEACAPGATSAWLRSISREVRSDGCGSIHQGIPSTAGAGYFCARTTSVLDAGAYDASAGRKQRVLGDTGLQHRLHAQWLASFAHAVADAAPP